MWGVVLFRLLAGSWLISEGCSRLQDYFPEFEASKFLDYPLVFAFSIFTCGYNWVFNNRVTGSPFLHVCSRIFLVFHTRYLLIPMNFVFFGLSALRDFFLLLFLNNCLEDNERFERGIFLLGCLIVSYARHPREIPLRMGRIVNLSLLLTGYLQMCAFFVLATFASAFISFYTFFLFYDLPGVIPLSLFLLFEEWTFPLYSAPFFSAIVVASAAPLETRTIVIISMFFASTFAMYPIMMFYTLRYWRSIGIFLSFLEFCGDLDLEFVSQRLSLFLLIASLKILGPVIDAVMDCVEDLMADDVDPCAQAA